MRAPLRVAVYLFGCDAVGLIWLLEGRPVVALTESTANPESQYWRHQDNIGA
jgi:hypothetical protein